MSESNEIPEDDNSISSFGDYRPYSEDNSMSPNAVHQPSELRPDHSDNSSDTANFVQDDLLENEEVQEEYLNESNGLLEEGRNMEVALSEEQRSQSDIKIAEAADEILYNLSNENAKIDKVKNELKTQKELFDKYLAEEKQNQAAEREKWEENRRKAAKLFGQDVIELNVGGTHKLVTTKATLCKAQGSTLAAMFNGKHKLKLHKGQVFIDRDGDTFSKVLSYLRNDKVPLLKDELEKALFREELNYWAIPYNSPAAAKMLFDSQWCASSLRLESTNTVISKRTLQHGTVYCASPLTPQRPYVEFKVTVNADVQTQKANVFIGLVDRARHDPGNLLSTFWKDSPCSFYWDVWNYKLIKVNENGVQTGIVGEYGCKCKNENTNIIGMSYDHKKRTVTFYKNGICLGVGFHNVPNNLYPAVDLWFEAGQVEIMNRSSEDVLS
eukprot:TRINITY_DN2753_c0_g1_i12.p1 TRINITY_DN2753_c0_g1~~TRINITY_DN2753_c0_g1_i12.p1  ORF type:complete len:440 (+),score=110.94 TRINITY_DN2753_c0_g1_i12:160-1479(+)